MQHVADIAGDALDRHVSVRSIPAGLMRGIGTILGPAVPMTKDMAAMVDWSQTGHYIADITRQTQVLGAPPTAENAVARLLIRPFPDLTSNPPEAWSLRTRRGGSRHGLRSNYAAEPPAEKGARYLIDLMNTSLASFFHSAVALARTEALRRAAGQVRPGGHLLIVSHVFETEEDVPPWAHSRPCGRPVSAAAQP